MDQIKRIRLGQSMPVLDDSFQVLACNRNASTGPPLPLLLLRLLLFRAFAGSWGLR
jgi:hypothetical protein